MGGNVTGINKKSGEQTRAEKIPLKKIGRRNFIKKYIDIFKEINKIFYKEHGIKIWLKEENISNGLQFNGSTSYIFDQSIPDEEIEKYKESAGDLDIIVPEGLKEQLWNTLDKLEGKEIIKNVWYMGSNKPTISSIGEQINCVFKVKFDEYYINSQVDFEFLPTEKDGATPTEWAKFSHNSSFEDAKAGIKAVHHKYLIQAIIGGASIRDDVVIVTKASKPEKYKIAKLKGGDLPRFLKFNVKSGVRSAYELQHLEDGSVWQIDGKDVYKEIPTKDSTYENAVAEIYKLTFGRLEDNPQDIKYFNSFVGIIKLMKKYLNKKQIENTHKRYVDKLWLTSTSRDGKPQGVQVLERDDPEADYNVKISGYNYFCKELKLKPNTKQIEKYYKDFDKYGKNESIIRKAIKDSIDD